MHPRKHFSIKSATVAGIAASALLGLAGVTLNPAPAKAVVYCQYTEYPAGCVARAGVVLRPRPAARAAVRHNAGGNANGCQSAPKFDPVSASNFAPFERRVLTVALASSELAGVAETGRARVA